MLVNLTDFEHYCELLARLKVLNDTGMGDGDGGADDVAEPVREAMDGYWHRMTPAERDAGRAYSAKLEDSAH